MRFLIIAPLYFGARVALGQTLPSLTAAQPLNPHDNYCSTGQNGCANIGEPTWCCPSAATCVFRIGGVPACCSFPECANEEGGDGSSQNSGSGGDPPPVTVTEVSGSAQTIHTGSGGTISVIQTNINDNAAPSTGSIAGGLRRYLGLAGVTVFIQQLL